MGDRSGMRWLALGGVAGPVLFTVVAVVVGSLRPDYQHATQFVSELGETGGAYAGVMNFAGFVPGGILIAAFGISLALLFPRTFLSVMGSLLIAVFGLGMAAAGVFPCDPGCPVDDISQQAAVHHVVSALAFLTGLLGTVVWTYQFRQLPEWTSLWPYLMGMVLSAFAFLMLLSAQPAGGDLAGLWQRLFLATLFLWYIVVGVGAFRLADSTGLPHQARQDVPRRGRT